VGGGSPCGSKDINTTLGLKHWQHLYDSAGVPVPTLVPGEDLDFEITLTIDHGGQAWMQIACAETIDEKNDWVNLPRAMSDRGAHFMPSDPTAFAWAPNEFEKVRPSSSSGLVSRRRSYSCSSFIEPQLHDENYVACARKLLVRRKTVPERCRSLVVEDWQHM
jgi:hypothetical protein